MAKMGVKTSSNNNEHSRRKRRITKMNNNKQQEEIDRLSSLPDHLLTDILSRLPINSAAATSVLSHRWRHLWTGVTSFIFDSEQVEVYNSKKLVEIIINVFAKLTSQNLSVFHVKFQELFMGCESEVVESWVSQVCCQGVQHLIINSSFPNSYDRFFKVPADCLFRTASQYLVTLELYGMLTFDSNVAAAAIAGAGFPNLKRLCLQCLYDFYPWLGGLIECSPLLEHLDLMIDLTSYYYMQYAYYPKPSINVAAPNLLSLVIAMPYRNDYRVEFFINAPNLLHIEVHDCNSRYYFVQAPTRLTEACIDLNYDEEYLFGMEKAKDDHLNQMVKFVSGLSSAHTLTLHLEDRTNLYTHSAIHGLNLPVFSNLTSLTTSLNDIGLIGCKDLLSFLRFVPNLKHLEVDIGAEASMDHIIWNAPDFAPKCFRSKLKTIKVSGLIGISNEFEFLTYVLSNAIVLTKLIVCYSNNNGGSKQARLWSAYQFCCSLFRHPRGSATCSISFHGGGISASSDDYDQLSGELKCTIYHLLR